MGQMLRYFCDMKLAAKIIILLLSGCGGSDGRTTSTASPSALCNDGTNSFSQSCSGTCSSHGGVAQWFNGCGGNTPAPPPPPAPLTFLDAGAIALISQSKGSSCTNQTIHLTRNMAVTASFKCSIPTSNMSYVIVDPIRSQLGVLDSFGNFTGNIPAVNAQSLLGATRGYNLSPNIGAHILAGDGNISYVINPSENLTTTAATTLVNNLLNRGNLVAPVQVGKTINADITHDFVVNQTVNNVNMIYSIPTGNVCVLVSNTAKALDPLTRGQLLDAGTPLLVNLSLINGAGATMVLSITGTNSAANTMPAQNYLLKENLILACTNGNHSSVISGSGVLHQCTAPLRYNGIGCI